jgi:hypothetical protein
MVFFEDLPLDRLGNTNNADLLFGLSLGQRVTTSLRQSAKCVIVVALEEFGW